MGGRGGAEGVPRSHMQLLSTMYFNLSGIQSRIGKKKGE